MRQVRLILYFVIGVLLASVSALSYSAGGFIGYYKSISGGFVNGTTDLDTAIKSYCTVTTNKRVFGSPVAMNCNSSYCLQQTTYLVDTKGDSGPSDDCFATANAYYCPDGKDWNGTACAIPDPCKSRAGLSVDDGSVGPDNTKLFMSFSKRADGDYTGQSFCSGGCTAGVTKEVGSAGYADSSGKYYGTFNANYSGQSCGAGQSDTTASTTPAIQKRTTPEYDCVSSGKGYGYFNGSVICTSASPAKGTSTGTSTKTNADGTSTKVTTDQTVLCNGTTCVTTTKTTTTTYDSTNTAVSSTTTSDSTSKADPASGNGNGTAADKAFCDANPNSPMCKTSSFSGQCSSGFTCDGDAVQCATAKAVWEQKCLVDNAAEVAKEHADVNLMKYDKAAVEAAINKDGSKDRDVFAAYQANKQNYFQLSSTCPVSSVTLDYKDMHHTIDLSFMCSIGQFVRLLLHFSAYMIVFGFFARLML